MKTTLDLDILLSPISADTPGGEDQRYTGLYDEIREARRAEDLIPQGEWEREIKVADWPKVTSLCIDALTNRTKDLQIAVWLTEALAATDGFTGIAAGFKLITGLLENFWEMLYPQIDDGDYDYRVAPVEFMNEKFLAVIRQIPLTDPKATSGFTYLKWQESRDVGYETEARREQRDLKIAEGKISAEEFDTAVARTATAFYLELAESLAAAVVEFKALDAVVDSTFASHAPTLADLGQLLDDCQRLVVKICREQKGIKDNGDQAASGKMESEAPHISPQESVAMPFSDSSAAATLSQAPFPVNPGLAEDASEAQVWQQAYASLQSGRLKEALDFLLVTANSQPSERGRNRYRFLVAKLCLKAGRPELARPIVEQLHQMITELNLEKWESPFWISEILEALYQCLTSNEDGGEDQSRAEEIFRRICAMDVTKALSAKR